MSAAAKIPLDTTLLQRVAATSTQTKLTREQRARVLKHALKINRV